MNQTLFEKVAKLKEEINNSPEVKELNRLNSLLENNEEVMRLCYKKDCAVTNYEDALKHFGENSEEAIKTQKALHQAKLELDSNELVKQYNEQFKIVRKIYDKINEEIFNPFN
ncbi:MAG: YlbF family regulator [Firmicutes bacterium]|nr:YlbF family regulator [Candidatus Fiminaster equi]